MYRHYSIYASILIFGTALLSACTGSRKASFDGNDHYIQVLESTSENWYTASGEGDKGTDYRIVTVIRTDEPLQFDSIWIRKGELILPLAVGRARAQVSATPIKPVQNDTLILLASVVNNGESSRTSPAPLSFEGDAILMFHSGTRKIHKVINTIKPHEGPPRPH